MINPTIPANNKPQIQRNNSPEAYFLTKFKNQTIPSNNLGLRVWAYLRNESKIQENKQQKIPTVTRRARNPTP